MKFIQLTLADGIGLMINLNIADISYFISIPKQGGGYLTKIYFNYTTGEKNEPHSIEVKETTQQLQKFIEQAR